MKDFAVKPLNPEPHNPDRSNVQFLNKALKTKEITGIITPAIKYLNIVIPAKAGIQVGTGCRIKSGMTELDYLIARLINN